MAKLEINIVEDEKVIRAEGARFHQIFGISDEFANKLNEFFSGIYDETFEEVKDFLKNGPKEGENNLGRFEIKGNVFDFVQRSKHLVNSQEEAILWGWELAMLTNAIRETSEDIKNHMNNPFAQMMESMMSEIGKSEDLEDGEVEEKAADHDEA